MIEKKQHIYSQPVASNWGSNICDAEYWVINQTSD